jgi:hypothetical protein
MSQAQEPSLPATSDTPDGQRLLAGLRELIRTLIRKRIFLQRNEAAKVIRIATGQPTPSLNFGAQNRVELQAGTFAVNLPFIDAQWIGVPLVFFKLSGTGTIKLTPTGFAPSTRTRPLINGAATLNIAAVGRYTLETDGANWFI